MHSLVPYLCPAACKRCLAPEKPASKLLARAWSDLLKGPLSYTTLPGACLTACSCVILPVLRSRVRCNDCALEGRLAAVSSANASDLVAPRLGVTAGLDIGVAARVGVALCGSSTVCVLGDWAKVGSSARQIDSLEVRLRENMYSLNRKTIF